MAKSGLHIANRIPKSLEIDHSNHYSEDLHLKITKNRVVKSRTSVNNSGSSRVTQNLRVTDHEE